MNIKKYTEDLYLFLKLHKNKEIALKQAKYMRNRFEFIGLMRDDIKKLVSEFEAKHGKIAKKESFQFCIECTKYNEREMWYIGFKALEGYKKFYVKDDLEVLRQWVEKSDWWDIVDIIASHHLGAIAAQSNEARETIKGWIDEPNFWLRRCAIIFQLKYKKDTDTDFLFYICKELAHEKEFFIRKAIGWALREYSKTNPNAVHAFIQENHTLLSPLSIKEGSKYL
jgi:3-methyladenine DNA glycosylase AlkD